MHSPQSHYWHSNLPPKKWAAERRCQPSFARRVSFESDREKAAQLWSSLTPFQPEVLTAVILEGSVEQRLPDVRPHVGSSPAATFLDPFGMAMPRELRTSLILDIGDA